MAIAIGKDTYTINKSYYDGLAQQADINITVVDDAEYESDYIPALEILKAALKNTDPLHILKLLRPPTEAPDTDQLYKDLTRLIENV